MRHDLGHERVIGDSKSDFRGDMSSYQSKCPLCYNVV